jgi:hypothetical protein
MKLKQLKLANKVIPLDIAPPNPMKFNEYHGSSPTFMKVHSIDITSTTPATSSSRHHFSNNNSSSGQMVATTSVLKWLQDEHVLMMCYPPPHSTMALDAIQR